MSESRSKLGTAIACLYCGLVVFFTILFYYFASKSESAWEGILRLLNPLWSPTSDSVLNFIIDAILLILGVVIGIGTLVLVLASLILGSALFLIHYFLFWLGSLSTTGAIISISLAIGLIILAVKIVLEIFASWSTRKSTEPHACEIYSGSSSDGNVANHVKHSQEQDVSPFLQAEKIDKAIFSDDKILIGSSGEKVGKLEKAIFSDDQIVKFPNGTKAGRIEQSIWDKNKQIIKGPDGKKEGEIKTDLFGNRIIVDNKGEKVGKIEKNIWGKTVIKKK